MHRYNFEYFPKFFEPEGQEYWGNVKEEFIEKYGDDINKANEKIAQDLGVSGNVVLFVRQFHFGKACIYKHDEDFITKIINYADWRVDPHGVVSYESRMEEATKRYKRNKGKEEERERLITCGKELEKQIFAKCKIKPEDINDETVAPIISKLKDFVIK